MTSEIGLFAPNLPGLIPVISADASNDELRRVRLLIEHKERDIAIRIRRSGQPAEELDERIRSVMRLTGAAPGRVHAVVDAEFVETVRAHDVAAVTSAAVTVSNLLGPEAITLLAGSIPAIRTNYATILRDRPEVTLWEEVRQSGAEGINYGDYGVTHPKPPQSGGNARTPSPYLCYTVPRRTVILRRKKEKDDAAAELFADLAEELVKRNDFAGPDYSWGDRELTRCQLTGKQSAGSVPRWVAMATSHHLEHVSRRTADDL